MQSAHQYHLVLSFEGDDPAMVSHRPVSLGLEGACRKRVRPPARAKAWVNEGESRKTRNLDEWTNSRENLIDCRD